MATKNKWKTISKNILWLVLKIFESVNSIFTRKKHLDILNLKKQIFAVALLVFFSTYYSNINKSKH